MAHTHLKLGQSLAARQVLLACRDLHGARIRDPRSHVSARVGCLVELGRLYAEEDKDPPLALKQYQSALRLATSDYSKEVSCSIICTFSLHFSDTIIMPLLRLRGSTPLRLRLVKYPGGSNSVSGGEHCPVPTLSPNSHHHKILYGCGANSGSGEASRLRLRLFVKLRR